MSQYAGVPNNEAYQMTGYELISQNPNAFAGSFQHAPNFTSQNYGTGAPMHFQQGK